MSEVIKNQHYIPKSYLKNFGFCVKSKKRNNSEKIDKKYNIHNIECGGDIKINNTSKICKMDYLYDLPFEDDVHKQKIEKLYSTEIDVLFPEVTKFISDDSNVKLSQNMREKILKCCISLYFRTPKHLEPDLIERNYISRLSTYHQKIEYNKLKTFKLEKHLSNFEKLYNQKLNSTICINKSVGEWDFISCDNPVIIRFSQNDNDIYSPNNIIHIPFTPKYCITILPEDLTVGLNNNINRILYNNHNVMLINHDIETNHEKYIFGSELALNDYNNESPYYKAPADKNHPLFLEYKLLLELLEKHKNTMEKYGVNSNESKFEFMYYWYNYNFFREDPNNILNKEKLKW